MIDKKNKTDRIFIRVTDEQKEFIKKMADKNNMSLSAYILSLVLNK